MHKCVVLNLAFLLIDVIKVASFLLFFFFASRASMVQLIDTVQIYMKPSHHTLSYDTAYETVEGVVLD